MVVWLAANMNTACASIMLHVLLQSISHAALLNKFVAGALRTSARRDPLPRLAEHADAEVHSLETRVILWTREQELQHKMGWGKWVVTTSSWALPHQ